MVTEKKPTPTEPAAAPVPATPVAVVVETQGATAVAERPPEEGEKCYDSPTEVMPAILPFGGAQSFGDLTEWNSARDTELAVGELWHAYRVLVDNIEADPENSNADKVTKIQTATNALARMLRAPEASTAKIGLAEKIVAAAKSLFGLNSEKPETDGGTFHAFKDTDGTWRWIAIHTNKFTDKQGNTFTEVAHAAYVRAADETKQYPQLRLWHQQGAIMGQAEVVDYVDGFVVSAGYFFPEYARSAQALAELGTQIPLGSSHGYAYLLSDHDSDGNFNGYFTFEVSPLPREKAANDWTAMAAFASGQEEGKAMSFDIDKRAFFVRVLGEQATASLEAGLTAQGKKLEDQGVNWKELGEAVQAPGPPAKPLTEDPPAPPAPPAPATPAAVAPATPVAAAPPPANAPPAAAAPATAAAPAAVAPATPVAAAPVAVADPAANGGSPAPAPSASAAAAPVATPAAPATPAPPPTTPPDPAAAPAQDELTGRVGKIEERMEAMKSTLGELGVGVKALLESDDAKIAALTGPKRPNPAATQRPSENPDNVVAKGDAEAMTKGQSAEEAPVNPASPYVDQLRGRSPVAVAATPVAAAEPAPAAPASVPGPAEGSPS